mgnify:FL=1
MMFNKIIYIFLSILAIGNIAYSFFGEMESPTFIGQEINIWLYRLIWVGFAVLFTTKFFQLKNRKN